MRNAWVYLVVWRICIIVASGSAPAVAQVDVLTQRYDNSRSAANLTETKLNTFNVNKTTFGKLAFRIVDGNVYAQPLIVSAAKIRSRPAAPMGTNIALVATEHNSVYAFDADDTTADPDGQESKRFVWHTGPDVLGTHVESQELSNKLGMGPGGCVDITTEIGITSTPVIQITNASAPKQGIVFVAAKSKTPSGTFVQKLYSLNLADGTVLGQIPIAGSVKGTGNNRVTFDAFLQLNRPGLALDKNTLYVMFGGHCDRQAYHGWIFAYDVSKPKALRLIDVFSDTLTERSASNDEGRGGIWMSGQGPAIDTDGNLFLATGDGTFNGVTDFGNSVLKIKLVSGKFQVQDWFTPANHDQLLQFDVDLGSGAAIPVPGSHLMLAGGKEGRIYLLDRNNLGRGTSSALHDFQSTNPPLSRTQNPVAIGDIIYWNIHGSPVIWHGQDQMFVYVMGEEQRLKQYKLIPDTEVGWKFESDTPFKTSVESAPLPNPPNGLTNDKQRGPIFMPGGFITVSSDGTKAGTGIVWVTMPFAENANRNVVRGILRAFDAADVSRGQLGQLWSSEDEQIPADSLGMHAKFCPPTVANGKVYVATFQQERVNPETNTHEKLPGGAQPALAIYGLK